MKSRIWVRCRSWLGSVMRGEIGLIADVLWLAEIDGDAPIFWGALLPAIGASGTVAGRTRLSTAQPDCRRSRPLRRSVAMRRNLSSVISPSDRVNWRIGPGHWFCAVRPEPVAHCSDQVWRLLRVFMRLWPLSLSR
jgi:hypothetical protein